MNTFSLLSLCLSAITATLWTPSRFCSCLTWFAFFQHLGTPHCTIFDRECAYTRPLCPNFSLRVLSQSQFDVVEKMVWTVFALCAVFSINTVVKSLWCILIWLSGHYYGSEEWFLVQFNHTCVRSLKNHDWKKNKKVIKL